MTPIGLVILCEAKVSELKHKAIIGVEAKAQISNLVINLFKTLLTARFVDSCQSSPLISYKKVFRFDVSMHISILVNVLSSRKCLVHDAGHFGLSERLVSPGPILHFTE